MRALTTRRRLLWSSVIFATVAGAVVWAAVSAARDVYDLAARETSAAKRVEAARQKALPILRERFRAAGASFPARRVFFRVFKDEDVIEVWAAAERGDALRLVHKYRVCRASGGPGPKMRLGDRQVPEGFYTISRFHPASENYLALGLDYPNARDVFWRTKHFGGDIFIHGGCGSIGCLAMTDARMREIYVIADMARAAGETIPVHVFPTRMRPAALASLSAEHPQHTAFWRELRAGYDAFERTRRVPVCRVDRPRERYECTAVDGFSGRSQSLGP